MNYLVLNRNTRILLALIWIGAWLTGTAAERPPGEVAAIRSIEIKGNVAPGSRVIASVQVDLEPFFHVHSNKPGGSQFIATELAVIPPAGVKIGKIAYPKGKRHKVEGINRPLSVYQESFVMEVPVQLGTDSAMPVLIPANLQYQACRESQCFPPKNLKFEIVLGGKK